MAVSNSSPLINFGKQGLFYLIEKCFGKIFIPEKVYDEIMCKPESLEAISLKRAVAERWLEIKKSKIIDSVKSRNIGDGEKEAISLAYTMSEMLLIDDDNARMYAAISGVEAHGTLYVLYLASFKEIIEKNKAISILNNFVKDGFYISTEIYSKFIEMLNKAEKG